LHPAGESEPAEASTETLGSSARRAARSI